MDRYIPLPGHSSNGDQPASNSLRVPTVPRSLVGEAAIRHVFWVMNQLIGDVVDRQDDPAETAPVAAARRLGPHVFRRMGYVSRPRPAVGLCIRLVSDHCGLT